MSNDQPAPSLAPQPLDDVLEAYLSIETVKYGASGKSLIERLFRRAFILIMEHNGVAAFDNKPVEYEDTIFAYYSAGEIDNQRISFLSGADFVKLIEADEYAVIARLKVNSGAPAYYVSTSSESFVTMAIMKFT